MEVISLIGILLGIVTFVIMLTKRFNLVLSGCLASLVIILFSGQPITDMITTTWATGLGNWMKSNFLIFALAAIFGRLMMDGGAAKRIAIAVYHLCSRSKKNAKFLSCMFVPIMYCILTFAGISGFVCVYTVVGIAYYVFKKNDVPWYLYCTGGSTSMATYFLAGSLQAANISAANICGTTITAGMGMSIIMFAIYMAWECVFIKWRCDRATKTGEHFMDTGAEYDASAEETDMSEEGLPGLFRSLVPMLIMILWACLIETPVIVAEAVGIVLAIIFYWDHLKGNLKNSLSTGLVSCFNPTIGVACATAMGTVIGAVPGYSIIGNLVGGLGLLGGGCALLVLMGLFVGSARSVVSAVGPTAFAMFTEYGLSNEISHRLIMNCCLTCLPPHCPGVANATSVGKVPFLKGASVYMWISWVGGGLALLVSLLLIQAGVFV